MNQVGGINVQNFFNNSLQSIHDKGEQLQAKMQELQNSGQNISQEQMLQLQFEMGQYNALLEAISTVTKSLTDSMKSIAQRAS